MKFSYQNLFFGLSLTVLMAGCTSDEKLKEQMSKVLKENPKILTEAIEKNPTEFIMALQNAAEKARGEMAKKRDEEEKKKQLEYFDKPFTPEIRTDEAIRGPKDAPITLVEYSDFECPFCSKGYNVVMALMKQYEGKIRFIYKHLPLSFHEQAMISAQYYEAIRLQDEKKAFAFHDEIFKSQSKLKMGEAFLESTAKSVGANITKLKKDLNSSAVKDRIDADMKEAGKFGMQGTPGFLINGIPVYGALPPEHFASILDELQKKGKIKL